MMKTKTITGWQDVTIGQYQEMMSIETDNTVTKFVEQVAIILDTDPHELRQLSLKEFKEIQHQMSFLSQEVGTDIQFKIEISGKKYGLITDMSLIDAGTFIDAEQFKQDAIKNLHNTVALIYRPIIKEDGDEYEIDKHKAEGFEKRANLFRDNVSIETVMGALVFFSTVGTELSINFLTSLSRELQTEMNQNLDLMKTKPTRTRTKKAKG